MTASTCDRDDAYPACRVGREKRSLSRHRFEIPPNSTSSQTRRTALSRQEAILEESSDPGSTSGVEIEHDRPTSRREKDRERESISSALEVDERLRTKRVKSARERKAGISVAVRWVRSQGKGGMLRDVGTVTVGRRRLSSRCKKVLVIKLDWPCESESESETMTETEEETELKPESESHLEQDPYSDDWDSDSDSSSRPDSAQDLTQKTEAEADESLVDISHSHTPPVEWVRSESPSPPSSPSLGEGQPANLYLRGGCGFFDKETYGTLGDDERVPLPIWVLAGARPGHPPPTGRQLREWKKKSKGNWPEGEKRGFFAEVVFVLSHGRHCRHHRKLKPQKNGGRREAG